MLTRGVEVWTEHNGAPWIGKIVGDFVKGDGTLWIVLEGPKGIWFSPSANVRNIATLYHKARVALELG